MDKKKTQCHRIGMLESWCVGSVEITLKTQTRVGCEEIYWNQRRKKTSFLREITPFVVVLPINMSFAEISLNMHHNITIRNGQSLANLLSSNVTYRQRISNSICVSHMLVSSFIFCWLTIKSKTKSVQEWCI